MQEAAPLWLTQICNMLCLYALLSEIKKGAFSCGASVQNVQRLDRGVTERVRISRIEKKVKYVIRDKMTARHNIIN